jgi:pilus assembly protein Flp/PilA
LSQQKENAVFAKLIRLLKNEDGATAIEYGMVAALVAVAAVTVLSTVGANLTGTSTRAANKL